MKARTDNVKEVIPPPRKQKRERKSSYQEEDVVIFRGGDVHLFGVLKIRTASEANEYLKEMEQLAKAHPKEKVSAAILMRIHAARKALLSNGLIASKQFLIELPHLVHELMKAKEFEWAQAKGRASRINPRGDKRSRVPEFQQVLDDLRAKCPQMIDRELLSKAIAECEGRIDFDVSESTMRRWIRKSDAKIDPVR